MSQFSLSRVRTTLEKGIMAEMKFESEWVGNQDLGVLAKL